MDKPTNPLRIQSMILTNFRGIASVELDFHPQLTLLAGRNGVGKTSLLEALLGVADMLQRADTATLSAYLFHDFGLRKDAKNTPNCRIQFIDRSQVISATINQYKFFQEIGAVKVKGFMPLIVSYSQERAVSNADAKQETNVFESSKRAAPEAVGKFKQWFFDKATDEAFEGQDQGNIDFRDPELEVIRSIVTSIDGIDGITSRAENGKERDLYFIKHSNRISIDQLSSGERVYFILAADLARRLVLAYPNETIETAPGLVLIDEIELHLHPAWQRKIIRQLRETFRNCQFVITTHSPQVMGGVEAECIRLLSADGEGNVTVKTPKASYGRNSADILEALLEVEPRVPEVENMLDDARNAIDDRRFDDADRLLTDLADKIEGDAPTVTLLRARLERLKVRDAS